MNKQNYAISLLTPCFCAGADPLHAEIRPASIRGQLRWWFRVLGGFKSLGELPLREQEKKVFGAMAGDSGIASPLIVRVSGAPTQSLTKTGNDPDARVTAPTGYFLFPLRNNSRGVFLSGTFNLRILWRGDTALWQDIQSLVSVFINLGALGFRARRGYGALVPQGTSAFNLHAEFNRFNKTDVGNSPAMLIAALPSVKKPEDALIALAKWYKNWRWHGRTLNGQAESKDSPGFQYAKRDHDIGYGIVNNQPSYRPALGLPIIQRTKNKTNTWNLNTGREKGRFASPVILRPMQDGAQIKPLVIFVDAYAWQQDKDCYIEDRAIRVSTDLYEAMKTDDRLTIVF